MATTDFSHLTDEELDGLYAVANGRPAEMPNAAERQAVIAEWSRRRAGLRPKAPDNVENDLDASASPITPDPAVKPKAKPQAAPSAYTVLRDENAEDPQERLNDIVNQPGLRPGETLEQYGQRYRAALAENRRAAMAQARPYREGNVSPDADQAEYDSATGLTLPPEEMEWASDRAAEYQRGIQRDYAATQAAEDAREDQFRRARRGLPVSPVPAPRNYTGAPIDTPDPFDTDEEAQAYSQRYRTDEVLPVGVQARMGVSDPAAGGVPQRGEFTASQQDVDMRRRGFVPVYTPDGVAYQLEGVQTGTQGMPGLRGMRPGLTAPQESLGGKGKYRVETRMGPVGPQQVLVPTDEFRKQQNDNNKRRSADLKQAKDGRLAHWRAVAMLAGGSQNLNSGNRAFYNQLAMLPEAERQKQLQYALPGGRERAAVEAANHQRAFEIARQRAAGEGFQGEDGMRQAQWQQMQRDAAIARADQLIKKYPRGWDGMYDYADVEEVRNAVERQHPGMGDAAVAHLRVRPPAGAAPRPGSARNDAPLPLPEGHGDPGRMPDGSYPMM
jgi:hypothetical protein